MNISENIRKLMLIILLLFVAMSSGLVYWQVIAAQKVIANIHNQRHCLSNNAPVRGRIFDRNGVLLADSRPAPGVCGYLRHYYEPSLAGLIGYYINPLYGSSGIEQQFNAYLNGQQTISSRSLIDPILHRPPVGDDIYLTIDVRIQKLISQHFDDYVRIDNENTFASDRGAVIVMDPHTGEVLAMLSRPGFDPNKLVSTVARGDMSYYNQLAADHKQPLLERPLQDTYIPGSSYKAVTLLAGLDSGTTTLDTPFDAKHALGPIFINGQQIGPVGNNISGYTYHFPVTTEYGFVHSDNLIFAQIGTRLGSSTWLDYNRRFYIGEKIPFDLPVVPSSILKNGQPLQENELAADAFGQGYDAVTPLQMALFNNAVAANGQLMRPMLVSKIVASDASPVMSNNPQLLRTPISSQTATQVRQAMYGVIRCGSGSIVPALLDSADGIIGKTSTGQVSDKGNIGAHGWMITQAPYSVQNPTQLPRLTIVAMKENAGDGALAVGPMLAGMYHDIFAEGYVKVDLPPAIPNYCCSTRMLQCG
ncbi:penicillin-binding protein [Ktedonosporobacter rubrisoli]|uniref:Penicillin-binding protein n=1 Tax=Ktedonosporobacter rubrisoli TaxID=2509675 RepID=A0A4V0YY10_KTERU|nr:penicillin-binding transpeptidase domain-containing protein [Ktedonosporobacter rubrisoli]QBD74591.1 penicillin-binding protein [Ktedonosporobacter rubrisoli]